MWIELATDSTTLDVPVEQRLPLVQGIPFLEELNREVLATNQNVTIDYFIYYEKEQELPVLEASLTLPIQNQRIIDTIQATVSNMANIAPEDKEAFLSLFQKGLQTNRKKPVLPKKKSKRVQKEKKQSLSFLHSRHSKKLGLGLGGVFILIMVLVSGSQLLGNFKEENHGSTKEQATIQQLQEKVNNLETKLNTQDKLETFNRFFLTNYYSGTVDSDKAREKVKSFVSSDSLKEFSGTSERVKSIFPWAIEKDGRKWKATYVVSIQEKSKVIKTKKVSFTIQEDNHQYQIVALPKETPFDVKKINQ